MGNGLPESSCVLKSGFGVGALLQRVIHHRRSRRFLAQWRYSVAMFLGVVLIWSAHRGWFWWALGVSVCGELLQLWAASCLQKHEVFRPCGPYTLVRNPMYCGRFLVILGMVGVAASVYALLAYVAVFIPYVMGRVAREEDKLGERFGKPYRAYLAAVPRFIPVPGRVCRAYGSLFEFHWSLVVRNREHLNLLALVAFYLMVWLSLALEVC